MSVDLATLGIRVDASQVNKADRELEQLEKTGRKVEGTAKNMGAALAGAFIGLGIAETARKAVELADTYSNMQGRLGLVTKGTAELGVVTERLYQISQRSRGSFEATTELYAKLAQATQQLKVGQTDLLQVTETISKALIVSGAGAQESEGALRQLGQAFASGALRGDELNSIMESTPRLARAIAEGMGITVGQLRALGAEGKLTGSAVFDALSSQQKVIEEEFARMPTTVGQSFVLLGNAALKFVGEANEALGVTNMLAGGIKLLSENLDAALPVAAALGGVILLTLAPAITAAVGGFAASAVAIIATKGATVAAIPAQLAFAAAFNGTTVASQAATSSIALLKAGLMALSGVGVIALLGGIAAGMMWLSANTLDAAKAADTVKGSTETYNGALSSLIAYQDKAGISTKGTTAALDASLGITAQTTNAADAAAAASLRRAAAERQLTVDILRRAAAEMTADAEKLQRSARINRIKGQFEKGVADGVVFAAEATGRGLGGEAGQRRGRELGQQAAAGDYRNATRLYNESTSQNQQATQLFNGAANLSRLQTEINNEPLRPMAGVTPTVAAGKADGSGSKSVSDETRERERLTEAAKDYAAQLQIETSEIGKNAVQTRMVAVERAALLAPTEELARGIRDAGEAWKAANQQAATDNLVKQLKEANDQVEFDTRLQGMNAKEREVANTQRMISLALAEAEANGTPVLTGEIKLQTEALLKNAEARGEALLAADRAEAVADKIALINDRVRDASDGIRGLFGTFGDGLANLTSVWSDYGSHVADILSEIEQNQGSGEEATRRRGELQEELAQAEIDNYGNMLGAAKSFFDEKTGAYKVLQAAEQAYRIYQFAMAVQSMFFDTAETASTVANSGVRMAADGAETASSVAKSGVRAAADGVAAFAKTLASLPFPFNIAAGAVVLAALVGVGVAMKGGGSKGAASASSAPSVGNEKPTSYTPFISQDTYANDNRPYASSRSSSISPVGASAGSSYNGSKGGNVFDFSGANFSNANPDDIKRTIVDTFNNQIRAEVLEDTREQNMKDMEALGRQKLGR